MEKRLENPVGAALVGLLAGSAASVMGYFTFLTLFTYLGAFHLEFSASKPGFALVQTVIERGIVAGVSFGIFVACLVFWIILNRKSMHGSRN
jgi:hypothetical protein